MVQKKMVKKTLKTPKKTVENKKIVKKSAPKTVDKPKSKAAPAEKRAGRVQTAEGWKRETCIKLGKPRPKKTAVSPS